MSQQPNTQDARKLMSLADYMIHELKLRRSCSYRFVPRTINSETRVFAAIYETRGDDEEVHVCDVEMHNEPYRPAAEWTHNTQLNSNNTYVHQLVELNNTDIDYVHSLG
jgi:hypothetical protein